MSFTSIVKNEASKIELTDVEKIAELSAIIKNGTMSENEIKVVTENASVARTIFSLIKDLYNINAIITVRKGISYQKKYLYILQIKTKVDQILSNLGIKLENDIPSKYITDDEESERSYLRGIFLMTGSINDPKKSRYHLEFLVNSENYAFYINDLLNKYNLNSKVIRRDTKYMIYIKESEKISDFLRIINTYNAVLYYEDIRIYRDYKNMTNRINNCEQANVDRIIETAMKQISDIEIIMAESSLDLLDEKEQVIAKYRLKYKENSLEELSEIISLETQNPISKSGVYHRFKKISTLAKKIREKNNY